MKDLKFIYEKKYNLSLNFFDLPQKLIKTHFRIAKFHKNPKKKESGSSRELESSKLMCCLEKTFAGLMIIKIKYSDNKL